MADLRITELAALAGGDLASGDLLAVADISASETKKITVVDLLGNGVTLIADATIPGAKIVFGAGTLAGSAIADGGISATQLANGAVTAAKLGDESTVDLVTTLPGSGAFIGQIALNTDDSKGYIWNGSSWVSFKAAGSINTVVGDTAGIVNLSVTTSGDTVTITTSLDDSTGAAQFLAGPTASAGAVSYRQIASGDMPTASSTGKGAVVVDGAGIAMTGDQIVIDNTVAASGATYSVVQYNDKGLVVDGRFITAADLPEATSVDKGAVVPGTGLNVVAGGALNHTNTIVAGTAAKITFDAEGHVTASQSLLDTDIPELPASKLTSGTISASVIGTNTISGDKLANASTTKFGGAASTEGIVSFPTADFTGQYFFDSINGDLYLWDGNAWQPITITAGEIIFAGTYNANTNLIASVTTAGTALGLTIGSALPAATGANTRYYVVVSVAGTGTAPAPVVALAPPDMLVSNGTTWEEIDVSTTVTAQLASNVSCSPTGTISSNNVQAALAELDTEKLAVAGGTVTGELLIGATGSLVLEGSTADGFETTIAVVDPTADRTITLPDRSGTVITTGDTGTVTNTMLAGSIAYSKLSLAGAILNADINASAAIAYSKLALTGSIVNADINASAAIADTKLATISTAGKVSGTAITSGTIATSGNLAITNSAPSIRLVENDGTATHNQSLLVRDGDSFQHQTRSSAGTYVSSDYVITADASGATNHVWRIANTERARIDNTGNVGIGTTSPAALLSVSAATATGIGSRLNIENTESSATIDIIATGTAFSAPGWATVTDGAVIRTGANGSGGLALQTGSNAPISFWGSTEERARIDSAGKFLIGSSTRADNLRDSQTTLDRSATVQIQGTDGVSSSHAQISWHSSTTGFYAPQFWLAKSNASDNTVGTNTIVTNGTQLGAINFAGNDGSSFLNAANITAQVDGTPGSNDMPGRLVFATTPDGSATPSERMRIDSDGNVGIGRAPAAVLDVYRPSGLVQVLIDSDSLADAESSTLTVNGGARSSQFGVYKHAGIANPASFIALRAEDNQTNHLWVDNSDQFRISTSAGHIGTTSGTVVGTQTSDERLKNIIGPVEYGLDTLKQIEPVRYTLKSEPETEKLGFIAQQVQQLVPQSVFDTEEPIEGEPEDAPTKLGMEYVALIPVLVNAIKELSAENESLKARVAALELN